MTDPPAQFNSSEPLKVSLSRLPRMDYQAFFHEQDMRMNLPDDDFEEYLRRMGTYRRSPESLLLDQTVAPNNTTNPSFRPVQVLADLAPQACDISDAEELNEVIMSDSRGSSRISPIPVSISMTCASVNGGRTRNNYDPATKTDASGTNFKDLHNQDDPESEDTDKQTASQSQAQKRKTPSSGGPDPKRQKTGGSPTSPDPCYDPFWASIKPSTIANTSEIASDGGAGPSEWEISPVSRRLKRKPSYENVTESPLRNKRLALRRTPSPSLEEITSFSACPKISRKKSPALRPIAKEKQGTIATTKRTIPALDLRPIVPRLRNAATILDIRTSPNEGHSVERPPLEIRKDKGKGREVSRGAPSKLYLEVKERVAQCTSSRRMHEVVKLGKKSLQPAPTVRADESSIISGSPSSSSLARSSSPIHIDTTTTKIASKKKPPSKADEPQPKPSKGKGKEKPRLLTPVEYALKLQDRIAAVAAKSDKPKCLSGVTIFYAGGDMQYASERTRGRMDIIVRNGGSLVPEYDASVVTHIVTDAQKRPTLQALGLKTLKDIPDHIPTVNWRWVISRLGKPPICGQGGVSMRPENLWMYAAFGERMDAGSSVSYSRVKGKPAELGDLSNISDFTLPLAHQQKNGAAPSVRDALDSEEEGEDNVEATAGSLLSLGSPFHLPTSSASASKLAGRIDDPLGEFYAMARAACETGWSRHGEDDDSDVTPSSDVDKEVIVPQKPRKRGWTCDTKEAQRETCVNQDIIDKLQELKELHQAKPGDDDHWRVFSYSKCIRALRNHPKRIESFAEARSIRGVGEKTAAKIMEIIETGGLRRIGYERTDDIQATKLFQGIYGVGQSTAYQWYATGCRTLEDLVSGKYGIKLSSVQEIGIKFYHDINDRMPREEAKELFDLIKPIALNIDPKLFIEIMGSYRRGKATCGDIDILITRPTDDGRTHKGAIGRLLRELHAVGILTEDLAMPEDPDDLEATYRGLCRAPREGSKRRRIDFLAVPWQCRGAALLYYTGDDIFNRAIRMKANVMGYSLNQKGLFGGVVRDPRDRRVKLNIGTLVASETEQEIFKILNVPWQEPHERVRG